MPVVTIAQSPGRTLEQKRELVKKITDAFVTSYGVKPESVTIFLQDYDDSNWGKAGLLHVDAKAGKDG
ncbi:tautomerase family protein [Hahella aquimaris]|uniref:tautomerase family protein n=1 Tax=Hahella sp. HNIBRBA332 TaxID=3015983 RepID=UPI00273A762B|nr:tautomerase family protein [Hahella sp. HNIBRBA332]WLQ11610.1 tautomerase family protein [Hahella sp. HNIBRBA332]